MDRPLITCLLITYNQEKWIEDSLRSVLGQTWTPLEIVCSDDASSDGTWALLQKMAAGYAGPHRLVLRRNARRGNVVGHIAEAVKATSGRLIVVAAGDDNSLPQRVERLVDAWERSGRTAHALASDLQQIDEAGRPISVVAGCGGRQRYAPADFENESFTFLGAAGAYSRDVFESFGELDPFNIFEDQVLPFRAVLLGETVCVPEALVEWRRLPRSNSLTFLDRPAQRRLRLEKIVYQQQQHACILRQRLADLDFHRKRTGVRTDALDRLETIFRRRAIAAEAAAEALQKPALSLALLGGVLRGHLPLRKALKFVALAYAPGLSDLWFRIRNPARKAG